MVDEVQKMASFRVFFFSAVDVLLLWVNSKYFLVSSESIQELRHHELSAAGSLDSDRLVLLFKFVLNKLKQNF